MKISAGAAKRFSPPQGMMFRPPGDNKLQGVPDDELIERCRSQGRCLVTLDLGFSNPLVFLPRHYSGIVVLRLRQKPSAADLMSLVQTLVDALKSEVPIGKLWIVETGRVRIHQEETRDDAP